MDLVHRTSGRQQTLFTGQTLARYSRYTPEPRTPEPPRYTGQNVRYPRQTPEPRTMEPRLPENMSGIQGLPCAPDILSGI